MRGESLADARAKANLVQSCDSDEAADATALQRLALWATRYTPTASPWTAENGGDGFFLDIEGAAHLFGGEERLIADLAARLEKNFGLPARLAVAATPGAAWALARFHPRLFHSEPFVVLPAGEEGKALAPLPIEALRLSPQTGATLRRLGFKSVGTLLDKPRAPFAARFPAELLRRIDQALGRVDEPLVPVVAPPVYHSLRYLLEPIVTQEAVLALASRLMNTLAQVLARDDAGARTLRLSLYRVDGEVSTVDVALTLPTRDVSHVARMIALRLETLAATDDAGFGFEAVGLAVTLAEPIPARQAALTSLADHAGAAGSAEQCAALIDALRQRLGSHSVRQFAAVASHLPERAEIWAPIDGDTLSAPPPQRRRADARRAETAAWPEPEPRSEPCPRPLLLLPQAEPAEVLALVPDGPPRRFCWRGMIHEVAGAQGPERIGAEWWRHGTPLPPVPYGEIADLPPHEADLLRARAEAQRKTFTRDYYLVEDAEGRCFWLYREGLYERETETARWFVHGLFG